MSKHRTTQSDVIRISTPFLVAIFLVLAFFVAVGVAAATGVSVGNEWNETLTTVISSSSIE